MSIPAELRYTKTHEWIAVEGDTGKVGISDYAQKEISDVVFVELPQSGQNVEKEKAAAVVESVKAAFDIYAPVSGEIIEVNESLESNPALVNQDPYGDGWLFKIKISDASQVDTLFSADDYEKHIQAASQGH